MISASTAGRIAEDVGVPLKRIRGAAPAALFGTEEGPTTKNHRVRLGRDPTRAARAGASVGVALSGRRA